MFGIEAPELLVLLVVGLLVFGPDRLPEMARQAGSWVRDLRRMVANARRDLSEGIGVDEADLRKLQNLDPKSSTWASTTRSAQTAGPPIPAVPPGVGSRRPAPNPRPSPLRSTPTPRDVWGQK